MALPTGILALAQKLGSVHFIFASISGDKVPFGAHERVSFEACLQP
jgi:hypothetical protein